MEENQPLVEGEKAHAWSFDVLPSTKESELILSWREMDSAVNKYETPGDPIEIAYTHIPRRPNCTGWKDS
jgi:hypothetical protein